jgi:hypothetical protein
VHKKKVGECKESDAVILAHYNNIKSSVHDLFFWIVISIECKIRDDV